jgi:hypothetical protein
MKKQHARNSIQALVARTLGAGAVPTAPVVQSPIARSAADAMPESTPLPPNERRAIFAKKAHAAPQK